ncbi:MobQ family relaxase [Niallia sp. FSL W8-0635]|uniref:MobQ family relaxase n=2 Tax=Bacteria TaxID=2 RepID=UPI000FA0959E|nr:MobA/MobL family protein [Yersinia enterocolitica]
MAIYHLSMQIISRSKGQSAVASASYRSGEKLYDERSQESKYYKREVQPETMILAPSNSPSWVQNREFLWNEVERTEKRKDSQLAREINIALPKELSNEQQTELIKGYVQDQFVDKGMVADIAIHRDDKENPHAHIMLTMRTIDEHGFGKKNREWNADFANAKENNRGFVKSSENCLSVREQWSEYANKALEKANIQERITHQSHADRGLEILPTVHLGHVASDMEKKGIETDRGNINREVKQHNAIIYDFQKYHEEKQQLQALLKEQEQKKVVAFTTGEQNLLDYIKTSLTKEEPTLENISKAKENNSKSHQKNNSEYYQLQNKQKNMDNLFQANATLSSFEKQISEKEQELENTGFFQRKQKEQLRNEINSLSQTLDSQKERVSVLMRDNGISTREEIPFRKKQLDKEVQQTYAELEIKRKEHKKTNELLERGENILKNHEIKKATSLYPELKNKPIDYKTAIKLQDIHEHYNLSKTSDIPTVIEKNKAEIDNMSKAISNYEKREETVNAAEIKLKRITQIDRQLKATENNPYQYGRALNDPVAKEQYESLKERKKAIGRELVQAGYKSDFSIKQDRELVNEQKPIKDEYMKKIEGLQKENEALSNVKKDIERIEKKQQEQALSKGKEGIEL